jgi:hypothetical protein
MRAVALLLGLAGFIASPLIVQTAAAGADRVVTGHASNVLQVAGGCGPGFHWVPAHRGPYGRWIPGHCAPN